MVSEIYDKCCVPAQKAQTNNLSIAEKKAIDRCVVKYLETVPEINNTISAGECAPGCPNNGLKEGEYYPACDNVACDFKQDFYSYTDYEKERITDVCFDGSSADRIVHEGVCSNYYKISSCCTTVYDESRSFDRDEGLLERECDWEAMSGECKDYLNSIRCAFCNPSSSYFADGSRSIAICDKYAKKVFEACEAYCPQMKEVSRHTFFSSVKLGLVDKTSHKCFNGDDTPGHYLLDYEIALVVVIPALAVAIAVSILVMVGCRSKEFAETVDDKMEGETCVVAPESVAAPETPVELNTMKSVQSNQPTDSIVPLQSMQSVDAASQNNMSMDQMQMQMQMQQMQMMMMMNSAAMANGGLDSQNMMMSNQQSMMMPSTDLSSQVVGANAGTNPALNATVVPQ